MPRRPRIELAGKYHINNRGVAQMAIFKEPAVISGRDFIYQPLMRS